jgi:hypothetical protein
MSIIPESGSAEIVGTMQVEVGAGILREFQIRLIYRPTRTGALNPLVPPDTYETAGRFPQGDPDRHIEADGRFCLWHPLTEPRDFDRPNGLQLHLDRVRQFIRLQLAYEDREARGLHPYWLAPQWEHGLDGYRQWVREQCADLSTGALHRLANHALRLAEGRAGLPAHTWCPCGSRRALKTCHAHWARTMAHAIRQHPDVVLNEIVSQLEEPNDAPTGHAAGTTERGPAP